METRKTYIKIDSQIIKSVIIEPWHFVEDVKMKDVILIEFKSNKISEDVFSIDINKNELVLWVNFDVHLNYELNIFKNEVLVMDLKSE